MHPSRLKLEAYRLGEIKSDFVSEVEKHLNECERCCGIIKNMDDKAKDFKLNHDPVSESVKLLQLAEQDETKPEKPFFLKNRIFISWFFGAVATIALLIVFLDRNNTPNINDNSRAYKTRLMGGLILQSYVKRDAKTIQTDRNFIYKSGDNVYFSIRSPENGFITVFANNQILIKPTPVLQGVLQELKGSIAVEGESDRQSVVFILTKSPVSTFPVDDEGSILSKTKLTLEWE